jgi:hypothetical protein
MSGIFPLKVMNSIIKQANLSITKRNVCTYGIHYNHNRLGDYHTLIRLNVDAKRSETRSMDDA